MRINQEITGVPLPHCNVVIFIKPTSKYFHRERIMMGNSTLASLFNTLVAPKNIFYSFTFMIKKLYTHGLMQSLEKEIFLTSQDSLFNK
jgi:hypothetical protein